MAVIEMMKGCYTAIITTMNKDGTLDWEGLHQLIGFQSENGIAGVVAVGTTGESPTVNWDENIEIIARTMQFSSDDQLVIAGTGANSTNESLEGTREAVNLGVDGILLVDPYYNGPSSLEIRKEYYEPIAKEFPNTSIIPYIIPGRTGTMLLPEDLAILSERCSNVTAVKEATGDFNNMRAIRKLCKPEFAIISGDDEKTLTMMDDPTIAASGAISVVSNIFPFAMSSMVNHYLDNEKDRARRIEAQLKPMMDCVTVKTEEETKLGKVVCKARNPLATKTLMNVLGMPSGPCRAPLGKMTKAGLLKVIGCARTVYSSAPELFEPIEEYFDVDVDDRLSNKQFWEGLYYESY